VREADETKVVERKGSVPDAAKSREQVPTSSCREVVVLHKPKRLYPWQAQSTRVYATGEKEPIRRKNLERQEERE